MISIQVPFLLLNAPNKITLKTHNFFKIGFANQMVFTTLEIQAVVGGHRKSCLDV